MLPQWIMPDPYLLTVHPKAQRHCLPLQRQDNGADQQLTVIEVQQFRRPEHKGIDGYGAQVQAQLESLQLQPTQTLHFGRAVDTAIASRFGPKGCAVHSPSAERPGTIADQLRERFAELGVGLHTTTPARQGPALIECYPHVALLALLNRDYRVPYKVSRSAQYWKAEQPPVAERIRVCWRNSPPFIRPSASGSAPSPSPCPNPMR